MITKKYLSLLLTVTFVISASVTAAGYQGQCSWTNNGADQSYTNDNNWVGISGAVAGQNIAPVNANDNEYDAFIAQSGPGPVLGDSAEVNVVHMGGAVWAGQPAATGTEFTIQNGDLNVLYWFVIGEQFGSSGTLNMNGGSLSVGADLMIGAHEGGSGVLNMTAGSIFANQLFSAFYATPPQKPEQSGQINLDGGTMTVNALILNNQGRMDITGGTLVVNGDYRWGISDLSSWNLLTGYGGTGSILFSYDGAQTFVTATMDELYVDKFEGYGSDADLQAEWAANANASISVGMQQGHADSNSLVVAYDNTASPYVAEITKSFSPAKDFTASGMIALDIWLLGDPANANEPVYLVLEDGNGATQTIISDGDADDDGDTDLTSDVWSRWIISFGSISVDLTDIVSYTIGVGNDVAPGGTGTVLFDSLMLYGPRGGGLQADITNDSKVDINDFVIMASEWLQVAL